MPTNLLPEYYKIEERFREAKTNEEKIELLEAMIRVVPKHKGTDHLRADLRRKLSKLKDASEARKKTSRQSSVFHIDKEGAGQVAVVGLANTGKSALVAAVTNATPEVASFPFTTWQPTPGMMPIEDIQVQLIDTPALDREFLEPELLDLLRRVDMILILVDLQDFPNDQLESTAATLIENRIVPIDRLEQYPDDQRWYAKPFLVVVNKCDDETQLEDFQVFCELLEGNWDCIPISAASGLGIDVLKQSIFDRLNIIRVFSKAPGREADMHAPFVLESGTTVEEFSGKVHKDFAVNLKSARIWGSADFDGQMVSRDHILKDGDIVELKM
ncbi:MAG: TGS domain-containing protein [Anaerolineales bacterium]|nr:MAG: TGS domain-containing protein [Anaerolineales bacterium]